MRKVARSMIASLVALAIALPASAAPPAPIDITHLLVPDGASQVVTVDPLLTKAQGEVDVVVRLADNPLAVALGANAKTAGSRISVNQQRQYLNLLNQRQTSLTDKVNALGGREITRLSKVINAVIYTVDASQISAIAKLPNVLSIRPVGTYEKDLSETVPYIGAPTVWNAAPGYDGTGVRVAVLDSGIDYLHYNLGGSGVITDFVNNDPTVIEGGTFPTAKVIGGYDFVGEVWPTGALAPDPDPLDKGTDAGHGTHVADIIAGKSNDDLHKGVAPGASLYAVKVCSSVSTSCSGVALLQGMDFALDPNGDGELDDAVDVINMSLGSSYGQREDDLGYASSIAVNYGVVVVVSAGNSADKPYIVGSPSSTPEVISVAQTQVPSAKVYLITAGTASVGGSWQPWSGTPTLVTGTLAHDTSSTATRLGCTNASGGNPYAPGSHAGEILLMDRGTCAISYKVANAEIAGAVAAIVANNAAQAPGDLPPDFSYGGGAITIAGYIITLVDGNLLKTQLGQAATIDPASAVSLAGNMVASSSRGPSYSYNAIKPDIGAPGASLSAEYGTGNGETAFGGTSGAAPMVSGAVALLVQAYPGRIPAEIKSVLMNTGDTNIGINPVGLPGVLAPITRIGGGEVRVDRAFNSKTSAWDADDMTGSLSFGYHAITEDTTFTKRVTVRNYSNVQRTYNITPTFRYTNDVASGAVVVNAPAQVTVSPRGMSSFSVVLNVTAANLPVWNLNGGAWGGDGYRLQNFEFDGYLQIADATDDVHLAWQILPHRAAKVTPATTSVVLGGGLGSLILHNEDGAVDGGVDVFALTGTSEKIAPQFLPNAGENFAIVDLKAVGVRQAGSAIQFAINTYGKRSHPNYPAEFDIYIDVDRDSTPDFVLYNAERSGFAATGQNVIVVYNLTTGTGTIYYYADADLNSGNIIFTAPLAAMGMTASTQFDFSVYAYDNYFTGDMTDWIEDMTFTPDTPRYTGTVTGNDYFEIPAGSSSSLLIEAVPGGDAASPSQMGLLLMYRDGRPDFEADMIYVTAQPRVWLPVIMYQ